MPDVSPIRATARPHRRPARRRARSPGLALIQRIADLIVEEGLATPEGGDVRAIIGMHEHTWTPNLAEALHVVIPKAVPQSPDLGFGYSPN